MLINGTTIGQWDSPDITKARHHVAVTYDRGSVLNDPVLYVDGDVATVTEIAAPVGILTGDDTLKLGENAGGTEDLAATIAHVAIEGGQLWDVAAVNRARWWGRPHGGLQVYHPLVTDKLVDEGSAAETLTATGSTGAAFATPCVRPGSALMGMGVGW